MLTFLVCTSMVACLFAGGCYGHTKGFRAGKKAAARKLRVVPLEED